MLATLAAAALAQTATSADPLQLCCRTVGATGCPAELAAVGPGSTVASTGGVKGLWRLSCTTGARFDPAATMSVSPAPAAGSVLTPLSLQAAACFQSTCPLPEGLCLMNGTGSRVAIVACNDNGPPTEGMWRNPPKAPVGPVFVAGRMLGSTVQATGSSGATATTAGAPSGARNVDRTVPAPPPEPCVPNPALREASNGQVEAGNAAIVSGQLGEALDRYRAALVMNQCNAYAWTALGDALLQTGDNEPARAALVVATRLMPSHFHAWTSLGQAEERLGDRSAARRAYQQALAAKPGHAPAAAGLSRIGG